MAGRREGVGGETVKKLVLIMRGIPGSGKSTWIKNNYPEAEVFSADHYFIVNGIYVFDKDKIQEAHKKCFSLFLMRTQCLDEAGDIVYGDDKDFILAIDNTGLRNWEISPYVSLASTYGYEVKVVRLNTPPMVAASRNIHGVPPSTVNRMAKSIESSLPWWNEEVVEYKESDSE